jgi:hypothetical protein
MEAYYLTIVPNELRWGSNSHIDVSIYFFPSDFLQTSKQAFTIK